MSPITEEDSINVCSSLKRQETDIHPLPVKTRKISIPSENIIPSEKIPQPLPWVGTLNQSHKKIIMDNKELCSDKICFAQSILKKQFPYINGFQDTMAPIKLNDKWISNNYFQTQSHPSVQIHHTGHSQHWVTSIQLDKTNIYLLDSLSLKLSTNLRLKRENKLASKTRPLQTIF